MVPFGSILTVVDPIGLMCTIKKAEYPRTVFIQTQKVSEPVESLKFYKSASVKEWGL